MTALLVLCIAGILGNSTPILQPIIVGGLVDGFGVANRTAGFVSTGEMAAFAASALWAAAYLRRGTARALVMAGGGLAIAGNLFAIAAITSITTPNAGLLTVALARAVAGAGAGFALAAGAAMAARMVRPERVYGLMLACVLVFSGTFLTVVPPLVADHGLSVAFAVLTAVAALTVFVAPWVREGATDAIDIGEDGDGGGRWSLPALAVLGACFLLYAGHGAFWTYQERMGVAIGMSAAEIGHALGLASIAGFAGAVGAAVLGTRLGRTLPQIVALIVSIGAALLLVFGSTGETYALAASLIALFWFFGVPYLTGLAAAMDSSGRLAATAVALLNLGQAAGPFLAALIVGDDGFVAIGWLASGFYLMCLVLVVPVAVRLDRAPFPRT